jgi:NAD(P)-dependent dehydrogenase (short-subunit alcohol dehydrogenase family)
MDLQLRHKTAIVTGSTAGIGLAIARTLAAEGANVRLTGRSQEKLDSAAATVGYPVETILCDVGTPRGVSALVEAVPEADILINNLGMYEPVQFADLTDRDWQSMLEVNVMSGVRLSQHYLPRMMHRDWGRIIFIASDSALITPPDMIHYGVSKTAQLAISRGLAATTRSSNVTVNAVLPGTTRSEGTAEFIREATQDRNLADEDREKVFFSEMRPLSLIQRMIEPEEIASLVAYLSSPLSGAINGAAIRVDGGIVPTIV